MHADAPPSVLAACRGVLRKRKVAAEIPEVRHVFASANARKSFVARRGLPMDDVGEILWDYGVAATRPRNVDEVVALLDSLINRVIERLPRLEVRIIELMIDGRLRYGRLRYLSDIRRALQAEREQDLSRRMRALRAAPFRLRVPAVRAPRGTAYRFTESDCARAAEFLPRSEDAAPSWIGIAGRGGAAACR